MLFRLLRATDSIRAHFEVNYEPEWLKKAVQHCSVSNPAQTRWA